MEPFSTYSLEEFLDSPAFRRWVKSPTPEDEAFWSEWLIKNPDKQELVEQASLIMSAIYSAQHTDISDEDIQFEIKEILAQKKVISEEIPTFLQNSLPQKFSLTMLLRVAALMILISGTGILFFYYQQKTPVASVVKAEKDTVTSLTHTETNTSSVARLINLADGSTVLLQKNSSIMYTDLLKGDKREVYLKGDAFFEITKNAARPFFVKTQSIVAKVLGTSFYIKSEKEGQRVTILVKTGKVSIYPVETGESNTEQISAIPADTILTPHQHLTYEVKNAKTEKIFNTSKEVAAIVIPETHFSFNSTPLWQVFDAIEKVYGVNVVYDKESLKNCTLTARLEDESFMTKIELICKSLGMTYKVNGNDVEIYGKGC
jgi:hypothetical protein